MEIGFAFSFLYLGKNVVSYVSPDVSFSMRDRRDMIELQVQSNDEFRYCQMPIKTFSANGIITSMYSNDDQRGLVLALKDGKLQVKYYLPNNQTSTMIFHDNQTINDGKQHRILVTRQVPDSPTHDNMYVEIDKRGTHVPIPERSPLFFDVVTIGGSYRLMPDAVSNPFTGCFANVTYNRHPLLPEGVLKSDRYDCFYQQGNICDRQMPCVANANIRPAQFCGQTDCSMVCTPNSVDMGSRGLVRYYSQVGPGQREQVDLTIFTTSANSTLYVARDGPIQVSIVLQVNKDKHVLLSSTWHRSSRLELLPEICFPKWSGHFYLRLSGPCSRRSMAHVAMSKDSDDRKSDSAMTRWSISFSL